MEPVDRKGDQPMVGNDESSDGQKIDVLTARFEAISAMMMTFMIDNQQKMDALMIGMGPQGDQAREMGAIKQALRESDEKNELQFKKLEDTVYHNKQQVRFEESANKKRAHEEINWEGDDKEGGAGKAGSAKDGGVPCIFGGRYCELGGWPQEGGQCSCSCEWWRLEWAGFQSWRVERLQVVCEGFREEAHEEDPRGAGENGDQSDEYGAG